MGPGVGIAASVRPFSCHVPTETIIMSAGAVKRWTALRCWVSISAMNSELLSIPKRVHFVALNAKALRALANGDLAGGSAEAAFALHEYFVSDPGPRGPQPRQTPDPATAVVTAGALVADLPEATGRRKRGPSAAALTASQGDAAGEFSG
jgi:hypothetical protein